MKYIYIVFFVFTFFYVEVSLSQGPPITADKPIMLGGKSFTVKTLSEIRSTERGTSVYIPLMLHYLPTSNTLFAIHIPYLSYDFSENLSGNNIADIKLLGKYQFYRKDNTAKTWRLATKTLQSIPSGEKLDLIGLSTGVYEGYLGFVSGYETLKYGISTEIGYNWVPNATLDEFRAKLGFGVPLLKSQYPNKQVNLYFEYTSSWLQERSWYQLLYAQGVQYAGKNATLDLSLQLPLIQEVPSSRKLNYSLFLGTRYTF